MYVAKIFTARPVSGDRDPIRHGRAADRRQGTGKAGGPACGCISIASIQLPGLGGPSADWRQWDSFFTFIVKRFGQDVSGELRDTLGEAFLDSRYELTATVARLGPGQNPVPQLFLNGWRRLSPIMNKAAST